MISRILTAATLMAGAALLSVPAQAQTGTSAQTTINSGGASPTGSVGTTSNTPRDNSSSTSNTMGPMGGGTTNSPGMSSAGTMDSQGTTRSQRHPRKNMNYQAQASRSAPMGDAAERKTTECLNNAAAQHIAFDSCRR